MNYFDDYYSSQQPREEQENYIPQEEPKPPKVRKERKGLKRLLSIVLVVALVFGSCGVTALIMNSYWQREMDAMKAMGGMFKEAIKAAKTGEVSEDAAAKVADAMNKVDDASTSGLAKYSRLADEAEAKI